ncbi:MAG: sialidase family protein [Acidobacteriota bacterium]
MLPDWIDNSVPARVLGRISCVSPLLLLSFLQTAGPQPFLESELIFPLEHWHNHASCIVQAPDRSLLVCWFHGSGERQADDVVVLGSRREQGARQWSEPFVMEDVSGYPDTNPAMFIDPQERLWLLWPTILANEWHTALMNYRVSSDYQKAGTPQWEISRVLHVTPGEKFIATVEAAAERLAALDLNESGRLRLNEYLEEIRQKAADKLYRRLGWMTRAHPYVLNGKRLIVPLYSDGFSFSLMAISDDWGKTWFTSTPLVGLGNIQPSLVGKKDGTLVAYMRDNGPPPKRLHISESRDRGETWSPVRDSEFPNPGSGAEVRALANGNWVLIHNDLERGRYSLAVALSDDEGKTWKWKRHLERDENVRSIEDAGQYHYPSIIQAGDGTLHATYSYFAKKADVLPDEEGRPRRKAIKHAHFNEDWIRAGGPGGK